MNENADILIIGGGIAGVSLAISIAQKYPEKYILVIIKKKLKNSSTNYAQGGIASSLPDNNNIREHIDDTINAGAKTNDRNIVNYVVKNSYKAIEFLENCGVKFEKGLLLEGGHRRKRVHHYKDFTGKEIQNKLILKVKEYSNIKVNMEYEIIDLISKNNQCFGAKFYNEKKKETIVIFSNNIILATGGLGQLYYQTTNPISSNGIGISIAIKNNIKVKNIDLVQFHPTAVYSEKMEQRSFLVSESVRGEGAFLENINGERFMNKYDEKGDLAPRDIVSRSIFSEIKRTNSKYVFLNIIPIKNFNKKFPSISKKLKELNIEDKIPVIPTAHYLCGGIETDIKSRTSMKNLYAVGECACTGMHGNNRLASNSLLEAVIFGINFKPNFQNFEINNNIILKKLDDVNETEYYILNNIKFELKKIMQENMGVEKSNLSIENASKRILLLQKRLNELNSNNINYIELENMLILAKRMVKESFKRKENLGVFYNKDIN